MLNNQWFSILVTKELKRGIPVSLLFSAILLLSAPGRSEVNAEGKTNDSEIHHIWLECRLDKSLSFEVFSAAFRGYSKMDRVRKKNIITIIDFSKPSTEKRCFVIDIDGRKLLYHCFVAHGRNSGDNIAGSFSNQSESLKSSLGFYLTAETYSGKHGYSLRLDGLEKNYNDNARSREIVIHGADYVSQEFVDKHGRLGRSWGCPALPPEITKEVIDRIANGSCLFIYGKDDSYLANSTFINIH
jgi:hypothetical protein